MTRKAINFDLSTNELKKHFSNTGEPYNQIKEFMLQNGFEHRQYSGYVSKEPIDDRQIANLVEKLAITFSWLSPCIKEFDVTEIGEQYSLKSVIQSVQIAYHTQETIYKTKTKMSEIERKEKQKREIEKLKDKRNKENLTQKPKDKGVER